MGMGVLNFTKGILKIKLNPDDEDFTEFKYLTSFESTPNDETSTIETSTGTLQVGDNSTGAEVTIESVEIPDNREHAKLQHRIVTQGKQGFHEAIFQGEANTINDSTIQEEWRMEKGTFVASDSWSPTDMMTRSATLKANKLSKYVDEYDGTGSYSDAKNG